VRRRLADNRAKGPKDAEQTPILALPVLTFDTELSVHFNGEEIRAIHLPSGHNDGDAIVWFKGSNVVHLGDHLFVGMFPFVDLDSGGSMAGVIAGLERVVRELPADVKVIPGHGKLCGMAEVKATVAMLKETRAIVEAGVKAGKSLEQLKKEKVLARWDALAWEFLSTDRYLDQVYRDVTAAKPPKR
jgi:cyclase